MSNHNYDNMDYNHIPLPKRASVEQYDIILIDKEIASTQNKHKNQNRKQKRN